LSLAISLGALGISLYAAEQARRAADATERLASMAEEQVRPRLYFMDASAVLSEKTAALKITVRNGGNAAGAVRQARVDVLASNDGPKFGIDFESLKNAVIYPGDARTGTVNVSRRFKPDGGMEEIDCARLSPNEFDYSVAYELFGRPSVRFSETVRFTEQRWLLRQVQ
jgi:hypothetical protein